MAEHSANEPSSPAQASPKVRRERALRILEAIRLRRIQEREGRA